MKTDFKADDKVRDLLQKISLALFVFTLAGYVYALYRCYLPYNLSSPITQEGAQLIWGALAIPSFMMPFAVWLSNILNKKLSYFGVISVFVVCGFFASVRGIFYMAADMSVSYFVCSFGFALVTLEITILLSELFGYKKRAFKYTTIIFGIIALLLEGGFFTIYAYYLLANGYLIRIYLSFVVPILCLISFLISAINSFVNCFSKLSIICLFISVILGTLCVSFSELNNMGFYIGFFVVGIICFLSMTYDLIVRIRKIKNLNFRFYSRKNIGK